METTQSNHNKNISTLIHASTYSKYFFPLGNFIFPLALWLSNKNRIFVDKHGKQCLNFQISMFLYVSALAMIGFFGTLFFLATENAEKIEMSFDPFSLQYIHEIMPFFIFIGILAILFLMLFIFEICCVVQASVRASDGKSFHYPLSIPFIPMDRSGKKWSATLKTETL